MSREDGGKPPNDQDYFGIRADNDNHQGSQNSGVNTNATAGTGTNHTGTGTDVRTPTHGNDSKRGNKNSSRHKGGDSSRRRGHKNSGRDHHRDCESVNPHDSPDNKKKDSDKEDHHRRHTPKNLQAPTGSSSVMDDLEDMECYHGNILEEEIKTVLNKHGDYMLRMSVGPDGGKQVMVTIIWNDDRVDLPVRAKIFETEGGKEFLYTLDSKTRCPTIKDLIRKHTMMAIPVKRSKSEEIWLLNPIAKQSWELRPENVELIKKLGEGAFGEVYSGKLRLPLKKFCNVAVKVIKRSANTDTATMELQKEASIMRKLKHINIVRFFGMVVKKDTIMVVMELINGGGLDKYLKKFPDTSMEERTTFAAHIACGLAYLHGQKVMHRDIACRNCLLDMYRKVAKVSDFGLARAADEYKLRAEERIPIRWTAPEVVKTYVYTRQADIYAYAILVYEIFSNAALPFEGYTNAQIKDQINNNEFRPKFPEGTPPRIVEIISLCWQTDAAQRTPLMDVAKNLTQLTPKGEEDDVTRGATTGTSPNVRGKGASKEIKATSVEKPGKGKKVIAKSGRSKERGGPQRGKMSKEGFIKSFKSGRTKRDGPERKTSRERPE